MGSNSHDQNGNRAAQDLAWRVGGAQGSGVDTAALIFQRACGIAGLHLYGRREYYSNIMGRHSYYDVRASEIPRTAHRDTVDLLTTFEAETLARHALAVGEGGGLVHTAADADADVALGDITFLDGRFTDDLSAYLAERDLPATTGGLLADARNRGVECFEVDFDDIVAKLAERLEVPQAIAARTRNTLAVAVSTALLDFRRDFVKKALERTWPGRQKIIDLNVETVELTYNYVDEQFDRSDFSIDLNPAETSERRMIINGNQAVALGKLAGGIAVQSYYPISPATDESTFLEAHEEFGTRDGESTNVLIVQTEDEISAITMAAGAALTGARSSTATSGPGFALMCEGLGWACINEVPLVITLWQRGGPSTGMPTRNEQGDLRIATAGAHGDFPLVVVASGGRRRGVLRRCRVFQLRRSLPDCGGAHRRQGAVELVAHAAVLRPRSGGYRPWQHRRAPRREQRRCFPAFRGHRIGRLTANTAGSARQRALDDRRRAHARRAG